jgi:hypothetical protein
LDSRIGDQQVRYHLTIIEQYDVGRAAIRLRTDQDFFIGLGFSIDDGRIANYDTRERPWCRPSLGKTGWDFKRIRELGRTDRRADQDGGKQ